VLGAMLKAAKQAQAEGQINSAADAASWLSDHIGVKVTSATGDKTGS
jgi:hypothetical protein